MERVLASELGGHIGQRVKLCGWLHNLRRMGQVNFLLRLFNQLRFVFLAVEQHHIDGATIGHHVRIGENVPAGRHQKSRSAIGTCRDVHHCWGDFIVKCSMVFFYTFVWEM